MDTEQSVAGRDPLDKLIQDAERYQLTPQEQRWTTIELHARKLLKQIQEGGAVGLTYETRAVCDELAQAVGIPFSPEQGHPLTRL
jgi:hypothetical protein